MRQSWPTGPCTGHPPRLGARQAGGYRGQMAVLVKPNGRFGTAYMAAIKPLRYLFVVPALMHTIERGWQAVQSGRAEA